MTWAAALLVLPAAIGWSQTSQPGCLEPKPTVFECSDAFLPNASAPRLIDGRDVRPEIQRLLDEGNKYAALEFAERIKARRAKEKGDVDEWLKLQRSWMKIVQDRDKHYLKAQELTYKTFGLRPRETYAEVMTEGRQTPIKPWNPRYNHREHWDVDKQDWRPKTQEELDAEHTLARLEGRAPMTASGVTHSRDGAISLYQSAYTSPETLALMIFHETHHWVYSVVDEGREENHGTPARSFQRHSEIYIRQATAAAKWGVPQDRQDYFRALAAQLQRQAEEAKRKNLTWAQIMTNPQYGFWLHRDPNQYGTLLPPPAPVLERPEPLKEQGSSDFLEGWKKDAGVVQETAGRMREEERRQAEQARRQAEEFDQRKEWASWCSVDWTGPSRREFSIGGHSIVFRSDTPEQFWTNLIVLRECMYPALEGACLDDRALAAIDRDWKDPAFRDSLLPGQGTDPYLNRCLWHFVDNYRPGRGFKGIRKTVGAFKKEHEAELARSRPREDSPRREPESRQPEREPPPRRERECSRGSDGIPWREVGCP